MSRLLAGRLLARRHSPSLHLLRWLLHRLSVAVALSRWLCPIGLRLLSGTTWPHRWRHLSHLHGLTISTHRLWHPRRRSACSRWLLSRCAARHDLRHQFVLLHITAELEVIDTLLKADKDIVELHIEVVSLLQELRKLLLNKDSLVELLEERALFRIVACSVQDLCQLWRILLDNACNSLLLLLESLVLGEVLSVSCFVALEDFTLVGITLVHLHKFFNG